MFDSIDPRWSNSRDRDGQNQLGREIYRDSRERGDDPRDALLSDLDLPPYRGASSAALTGQAVTGSTRMRVPTSLPHPDASTFPSASNNSY
jgi:hypothetical protein